MNPPAQRYPLTWPEGWKRETNRARAAFGRSTVKPGNTWHSKSRLSVYDGATRIRTELERMGVSDEDVIISTNVRTRLDGLPRSDDPEPRDPGAAIYWQKGKEPMRCMAIDRYDRVADNLAAVAATLEAMRAIERHGGAEILNRTFAGFAALQEGRSWRKVMDFGEGQKPDLRSVEERYKSLARALHPDAAGSHDAMSELNWARGAARQELAPKVLDAH